MKTAIIGYNSKTGTFKPIRIDSATDTIQTIDYSHHETHAGSSFFYTDSVSVNSAGTQDYIVTTPNTTKWAHMTFQITGSAITQVQIYESSDRTGTTLQTVFNHNRNSATANTTTIHKNQSSGTTDGTLIWQRKSGSATQQSRSGDEAHHSMEIILKQNTKYLFRITSGTDTNLTNVLFDWYEHTNII